MTNRSEAARRGARTRAYNRSLKNSSATRWLEEASRATEFLIQACREEGLVLPMDADELRLVFAKIGSQIDRRNGYDVRD